MKALLRRARRGQSAVDYAITIMVTTAGLTAVGVVVNRGIQAKVNNAVDAYAGIGGTIGSASMGTLKQYQSYADESFYKTYTENVEQEHLGGGHVKEETVNQMTVRAAGGSQKQRTGKGRQAAVKTQFE